MRVFVENTPNPLRDGEKEHVIAIGIWPIWDRHPNPMASHQSAQPYQGKGCESCKQGELMKRTVVHGAIRRTSLAAVLD